VPIIKPIELRFALARVGWTLKLKSSYIDHKAFTAGGLLMMSVAGLSVAYHAKPAVREKAMVVIDSGGLDRLLEVMGSV